MVHSMKIFSGFIINSSHLSGIFIIASICFLPSEYLLLLHLRRKNTKNLCVIFPHSFSRFIVRLLSVCLYSMIWISNCEATLNGQQMTLRWISCCFHPLAHTWIWKYINRFAHTFRFSSVAQIPIASFQIHNYVRFFFSLSLSRRRLFLVLMLS